VAGGVAPVVDGVGFGLRSQPASVPRAKAIDTTRRVGFMATH